VTISRAHGEGLVKIRDDLPFSLASSDGSPAVEWSVEDRLVGYEEAVAVMEARVAAIAERRAPELVWLVEHPPLYTGGTSAQDADLVQPSRFPVFRTGRGGQYTYHGPGQRVAYVMLDLARRSSAGQGPDLRRFVAALEAWLIGTLDRFNIRGERREDRVGVWVRRSEQRPSEGDPPREDGAPGQGDAPWEDKIAAIGIRVRRWVTFHGISLNVEPDLSHFDGIVPCGVREHGVTSLVDLGLPVTMHDADVALRAAFEEVFGPVRNAPSLIPIV